MKTRNANLDLLRALAICLVVTFHVVPMWPTPAPALARFTALGAYGVDLFFVLSGWLVGGLFWREYAMQGTVQLGHFVLRRILRTVPCYLIALLLSWLAVRVTAPERAAFDWKYLVFAQNYERTMPYFLISWSLCIEEHFYLAMPLAMILISRFRPALLTSLWLLCFVPVALRAIAYSEQMGIFGYEWTATHLRFEGLLAGVLAAHAARARSREWVRLRARASLFAAFGLVSGTLLFFVSQRFFYVLGLALFAAGFLFLLISMVEGREWSLARLKVVKAVAIGSYSGYLTHALMIHAARAVIARFSIFNDFARGMVFLAAIVGGASVFYRWVERPTMTLREQLVPSPP